MKLFTATAILFTLIELLPAEVETSKPPNLIIIISDNQPAWAMGCAGNKVISTPHLDHLAAESVRFQNAFVTTPICSASRASILTGMYRRRHGFTFNTDPLQANLAAISYPALLRENGYRTALIGKFGIESNGEIMVEDEDQSLKLMFDDFDNFEHWGKSGPKGYFVTDSNGGKKHLTDVTTDKANAFLKQRSKSDQPFCLTLCFNAPHAQDDDPRQYIWPVRFDEYYTESTIPTPRNSDHNFFKRQPNFLQNSLGRERWRWRFNTPKKFQRMMKGMYRMVSGVDDAVGRLRDQLKKLDLTENTIIIYSSDNGMFFGERGLSDCWLLYEESIRVPLIIFDPRTKAKSQRGKVRQEMVLNLDLAPTLLDFAGVKNKPPMDGRSFKGLLSGNTKIAWREDFLFEHLFEHKKIPKSEGVRSKDWKYIRYFEQDPIYEEFYDLKNDPHERDNLLKDPNYFKKLNSMRQRCDKLLMDIRKSVKHR